MTQPVAVLRADASPTIGGGHVMRMLALAEPLRAAGWKVILATRPETSVAVPEVGALPQINVDSLTLEEEPARLADALPDGCDLLIVDSYAWGYQQETACRSWAKRIASLDDFAAHPHNSDLIIDPTPGRSTSAYRDLAGEVTKVLAGAAWAPLRPKLRMARLAAAEARLGRQPKRLFIGLGMTDPRNATGRIIEGLRELHFEGAIDIVLGLSAPHRDSVARALPKNARLHLDPPYLVTLMSEADLAIGAGGVSALERACLGLPSLLVEVADNQQGAIAGLVAVGAACALGPLDALEPRRLRDTVAALLEDRAKLADLSAAAFLAVDGLGAARVAIALTPGLTRDGVAVTLRPVAGDDDACIFDWQREPGLRRHFRISAPPSVAEHAAWLAASLKNPARILSIILCDEKPAGLLRLDRELGSKAETHEVSILVAPSFQGRGIAKAALGLATRMLPDSHFAAHVLTRNTASRALFAAAGYRETAPERWTREPLA
jgi:UDP-2,4-diacetamido-2,4,6-trideoxy-beta-L-altropyranose hydrolase